METFAATSSRSCSQPSLVGGISGAELLLHTSQPLFLHLIPWLLLTGSLIFGISGPVSRRLRARSLHAAEEHSGVPQIPLPALALALLPVTLYIGYFGAGGGFLIMTILALFGMQDMHQLNALKIVAACASNLLCQHHLHPQRTHPLALLPDLDDLRWSGWLLRGSLRSRHEPRRPPSRRRGNRPCDRRILLLEAALTRAINLSHAPPAYHRRTVKEPAL